MRLPAPSQRWPRHLDPDDVATTTPTTSSDPGSASASGAPTTTTSPPTTTTLAAHHDDTPSCRHLGRHVAEVTTSDRGIDAILRGERSFRALGTTATVVVPDPIAAQTKRSACCAPRSRPSTWPAVAFGPTPSWRTSTPTPAAPSRFLRCSSKLSTSPTRWPNGPTVPSTRPSAEPWRHSATTATSNRSSLAHCRWPTSARSPDSDISTSTANGRTARIPKGVRLDLGSSAKALLADRAAARIADELGSGSLVSVGGDVAVAGEPPPGGWAIGIAVGLVGAGADEVDQVVAIRQGGLASSSTEVRTWQMGIEQVHHIVDPATGCTLGSLLALGVRQPAPAASTPTPCRLPRSSGAIRPSSMLRPFGQAVRLLRHDGEVFTLGGWPEAERP